MLRGQDEEDEDEDTGAPGAGADSTGTEHSLMPGDARGEISGFPKECGVQSSGGRARHAQGDPPLPPGTIPVAWVPVGGGFPGGGRCKAEQEASQPLRLTCQGGADVHMVTSLPMTLPAPQSRQLITWNPSPLPRTLSRRITNPLTHPLTAHAHPGCPRGHAALGVTGGGEAFALGPLVSE